VRQIIHALTIRATPASVYRALTTEAGVTGWWTTKAHVEEGQGNVIRFTFAGDFHPHMKQTRLEPNRRVEWQCVAGHANWQENRFAFSLDERDGATAVMFLQDYARELSDEVYGTYNFNWGYYLNSLKLFCEKGRGTPFNPPARSGEM
jgi:uncharacterized protein YndB with AHSA1/START domain